MSDNEKSSADNETILMALDQISQTIEVMTSVVGRLRHHVERREAAAERKREKQTVIPADRILH